jgi:hypothetical protein
MHIDPRDFTSRLAPRADTRRSQVSDSTRIAKIAASIPPGINRATRRAYSD